MNRDEVASIVQALAGADYLIEDGDVGPNREAQQIIDLRQALRTHEGRLDIAWCGAAVARIFRQHPWLQNVRLELWTEAVYNDEGGTFMAHYARFHAATAVHDAALPGDAQDPIGTFDPDAAAQLLDEQHEDDAFDFCALFIDQGTAQTCELTLDRGALGLLMSSPTVSGLAAARLLWPDHESLRSSAEPSTASVDASACADSQA